MYVRIVPMVSFTSRDMSWKGNLLFSYLHVNLSRLHVHVQHVHVCHNNIIILYMYMHMRTCCFFLSLSLQAWVQAKRIQNRVRQDLHVRIRGAAVDHAVMCSLYFSGETSSFHCLNKVLVHIYNGVYST